MVWMEDVEKLDSETTVAVFSERLHQFYSDDIGPQKSNAYVAQYMDMLAHKNPDMNILEIGAGTGEITLPVLQALGGHEGSAPRFLSYTFTDMRPESLDKARDKLKPWASVTKLHMLSIEKEPSE